MLIFPAIATFLRATPKAPAIAGFASRNASIEKVWVINSPRIFLCLSADGKAIYFDGLNGNDGFTLASGKPTTEAAHPIVNYQTSTYAGTYTGHNKVVGNDALSILVMWDSPKMRI